MLKIGKWWGIIYLVLFLTIQVAWAKNGDYKVEVNTRTNRMYLYQGEKVRRTYVVATGTGCKHQVTPKGTFVIVNKIIDPGWRDMPGGVKKNPLGPRWHGLQVNGDRGRIYGIHGTIRNRSIGRHTTNGCVRMYNNDVVNFYNMVEVGTVVWIHSGKSNGCWRGVEID
jgi:lipoprotein-anchoring transpeptidase ErfK/SrfK